QQDDSDDNHDRLQRSSICGANPRSIEAVCARERSKSQSPEGRAGIRKSGKKRRRERAQTCIGFGNIELEPSHDAKVVCAHSACIADSFGAKGNSDVKLVSSNDSEEA